MTQQSSGGGGGGGYVYMSSSPSFSSSLSLSFSFSFSGVGREGADRILTLVDLQRISSTGGVDDDDSNFISVSSFIILALLWHILRICCLIISFAYSFLILSLVELPIDCIIHADIPWPVTERNPASASCNTGEFYVIIFIWLVSSLFFVLFDVIPNFWDNLSTISSSFFICFALFVPTGHFMAKPTPSLYFFLTTSPSSSTADWLVVISIEKSERNFGSSLVNSWQE